MHQNIISKCERLSATKRCLGCECFAESNECADVFVHDSANSFRVCDLMENVLPNRWAIHCHIACAWSIIVAMFFVFASSRFLATFVLLLVDNSVMSAIDLAWLWDELYHDRAKLDDVIVTRVGRPATL